MATTAVCNFLGVKLQPVLRLLEDWYPSALRAQEQPSHLPKFSNPPADTPTATIDAAFERLSSKAANWAAVSTAKRARLLDECLACLPALAKEAAHEAALAKGSYGNGDGEELCALMSIALALREYSDALAAGGAPAPSSVRTRKDGQEVAVVFPQGAVALLFGGFRGEVWMQPGHAAAQGALYRSDSPRHAGVSVVLGAGNQTAVGVLDVLHCLLARNEVVLLKTSPINGAYMGPFTEKLFAPFVKAGWLEVVHGGVDVGRYVCNHACVGHIHLTGAAATYNAVVWGGPDKVQPAPATPPLTKPVSAELGNVTPFIVVPSHSNSKWKRDELIYHAHNIAAGMAQNCAHNCIAAQVVVTSRDWPQRGMFMDCLRYAISKIRMREPYYPGSKEKYQKFHARYPGAQELGKAVSGDNGDVALPWLLMQNLSPAQATLDEENWCGVLQEVTLPESDPAAFMDAATRFCNEKVWGQLAAAVFIHPNTQERCENAFDNMIAGLRYGCITVNVPCTMGFSVTALPWGAFPGNTPNNISSGAGFVHNTMLFDAPQKGVLYGPWSFAPKPLWHIDNRALESIVPNAMEFLAKIKNPFLAMYFLTLTVNAALRG